MKPISKSKRQLAQLLIEAGVKKFPDGAEWAAQDRDTIVHDHPICFYANKPHCNKGSGMWNNDVSASCVIDKLSFKTIVPNWHQTVLSRAEFDQIVAESAEQSKPDADGWIEWKGGECPVGDNDLVVLKMRGGYLWKSGEPVKTWTMGWGHDGDDSDIIAYRLHNPKQVEPQYCESVTRAIPEPVTVPTLDQLLQDYRNAADFATRKQAEADEAAKMRDERWQAIQARAGEMGVTVERCDNVSDKGWIEWSGGECPVGEEQLVRIRVRGETDIAGGKAGHLSWGHRGDGGDIIAYRLARP